MHAGSKLVPLLLTGAGAPRKTTEDHRPAGRGAGPADPGGEGARPGHPRADPLVSRGYGFAVADVTIVPRADPGVIAALHQATVAVAYREYFPDSPPPTVAELHAIWAERLADPTAVALVACRAGQPVGSVMARADPDFPGGQLVGLHVLPSEWGKGIGSGLHDAALAVLSEAGYHDAGLWVIAENNRARRMYERRGWVRCPRFEQQAYGVIEARYRRELP